MSPDQGPHSLSLPAAHGAAPVDADIYGKLKECGNAEVRFSHEVTDVEQTRIT